CLQSASGVGYSSARVGRRTGNGRRNKDCELPRAARGSLSGSFMSLRLGARREEQTQREKVECIGYRRVRQTGRNKPTDQEVYRGLARRAQRSVPRGTERGIDPRSRRFM